MATIRAIASRVFAIQSLPKAHRPLIFFPLAVAAWSGRPRKPPSPPRGRSGSEPGSEGGWLLEADTSVFWPMWELAGLGRV